MAESGTQPTKRRKRPHVPETTRKRVARACGNCRRVKEKCQGGEPCSRCTRLSRECKFDVASESSKASHQDYFDPERIHLMEQLLHKYADDIALDVSSMKEHLHAITTTNHAQSGTTAASSENRFSIHKSERINSKDAPPGKFTYSAELSHCRFFDSVQSKIDERVGKTTHMTARAADIAGSTRTARLLSPRSTILDAVASMPPVEVARFLVDMFFKFAETNYCYIDEVAFRSKLETVYSNIGNLTAVDAPSVSTILMVFALGTQFAHLSSDTPGYNIFDSQGGHPEDASTPDDNVALNFYHTTTALLPDVLVVPCLESVYTLLLLGVYTLPIDAAGLAYTYLGMAIRVAVQIEMHRNETKITGEVEVEMRNRTFWTAYILEKRIGVLHGMPTALWRTEVDAKMPKDLPRQPNQHVSSNVPNFIATINMTCILEDAGSTICSLKTASPAARSSAMATLSGIVTKLTEYWSSLPQSTWCRDLDPKGALFRPNVHLGLTYHLIRMFIGRNFIFDSQDTTINHLATPSGDHEWEDIRGKLISSCMESALSTIELCQLLQDEVGLARASYTEFTSCRTAVLVIIAKRIQESTKQLHNASEKGLDLLKHMSVGLYSASAEKAAIGAMEVALRRLNRNPANHGSMNRNQQHSAYDNFRNWATLWSKVSSEQHHSPEKSVSSSANSILDHGHLFGKSFDDLAQPFLFDFDPLISAFPFEFESAASMSTLEPNYNLQVHTRNG